jgi:hypothetical protein
VSCALAAIAAALVTAGAPARAGPGASLGIRAEPASLALGRGARAAIVVDADGDAAPTLSASVGRIEGVRPIAGGGYVGSYLPPREAYPQVAIVTAMTADRFGWVALPLVGRGIATARAPPGASIQVTIGAATFGPVRADGRGEARVPVIVPPGVRFAYHRDEPLDLRIPPTLHVHLAAGRSEVPADATAEVPVVAVAVASDGSPRAGAPLEIFATHGEIELAEVAAGTFAGIWRVPAGAPGVVIATARLLDEPGPSSAIRLSRPVGAPARIEIAGAPARASAEDDVPVTLRLGVTDAVGNPVAVEPRVETTVGSVSGPVALGAGAWEAKLAFPREIGSARRAEVTVRAAGLEERIAIDRVGGAPTRLAVASEASALVADGGAETRVRVTALDRFGNAVVIPAPHVEVTRPAAVGAEADDSSWVFRYRPRRAREDAAEVLSIRAGALESIARIALVAPERRLAIAPKLGVGVTTGGVRPSYAAAEASYWTAALGGRLGVALELGWLVHERTDAVTAGALAVPVHGHARYVPLVATAWWREPLGVRSFVWAGLGAGVAHVASEVSVGSQVPSIESGLVPTAHASLAWGLRVGHVVPFVELRALRHGDPGFDSLVGSLTALSASAGFRYDVY